MIEIGIDISTEGDRLAQRLWCIRRKELFSMPIDCMHPVIVLIWDI